MHIVRKLLLTFYVKYTYSLRLNYLFSITESILTFTGESRRLFVYFPQYFCDEAKVVQSPDD